MTGALDALAWVSNGQITINDGSGGNTVISGDEAARLATVHAEQAANADLDGTGRAHCGRWLAELEAAIAATAWVAIPDDYRVAA